MEPSVGLTSVLPTSMYPSRMVIKMAVSTRKGRVPTINMVLWVLAQERRDDAMRLCYLSDPPLPNHDEATAP